MPADTLHLAISVILVSMATNADNLAVGLAYGLRGIQVGPAANAGIAVIGGVAMAAGIGAGRFLSRRVPIGLAHQAGGVLLVLIGLATLLQTLVRRVPEKGAELRLRRLGLIIRVLRAPEAADRDRSGRIDGAEIWTLGLALAANNAGTGAGAGLIGLPALPTALVTAAFSFLAFSAGAPLARARWRRNRWSHLAEWGAGLLLIVLGLFDLV